LDDFHFILLRFSTLLDDFEHTLSSFNSPRLSLSSHYHVHKSGDCFLSWAICLTYQSKWS